MKIYEYRKKLEDYELINIIIEENSINYHICYRYKDYTKNAPFGNVDIYIKKPSVTSHYSRVIIERDIDDYINDLDVVGYEIFDYRIH